MVAGGGASGLNAVPIARELGCRRVLLPVDGERALRLRSAVRGHRLRVLAQPLRGDALARPRGSERRARRRRGAGGRVPRGSGRAAGDGGAQGLLRRGPVPRPGVGARRAGAAPARIGRGRPCGRGGASTRRTSASSPCGSRDSTWSACSGRCVRRPCSTSRSCGRDSRRRPAPTVERRGVLQGDRARDRPTPRRSVSPCRNADRGARRSCASRRRRSSSTQARAPSSRSTGTTCSSSRRSGPRARRLPKRRSRDELLRPRHARCDREPARLDRPRDGEHAPPHRPLGRPEHGARLLLRADHRRQPPARVRRGPAGACDRHGVPRRGDDRPPPGAGRGRRVPAQRPVPRQHASGRPRHPRPGLLGGPARVHSCRQGAPGRLRQRPADDLHAVCARRLRGGQPDLPGGARAAGLPRRRRRDPHVPPPDPGTRPVVRRLPGDDRRGPDRRGAPEGALRASTGRRPWRSSSRSGSTTPSVASRM